LRILAIRVQHITRVDGHLDERHLALVLRILLMRRADLIDLLDHGRAAERERHADEYEHRTSRSQHG
jgi:ABC-type multidrug transport system fused ATPase/permease subunit